MKTELHCQPVQHIIDPYKIISLLWHVWKSVPPIPIAKSNGGLKGNYMSNCSTSFTIDCSRLYHIDRQSHDETFLFRNRSFYFGTSLFRMAVFEAFWYGLLLLLMFFPLHSSNLGQNIPVYALLYLQTAGRHCTFQLLDMSMMCVHCVYISRSYNFLLVLQAAVCNYSFILQDSFKSR